MNNEIHHKPNGGFTVMTTLADFIRSEARRWANEEGVSPEAYSDPEVRDIWEGRVQYAQRRFILPGQLHNVIMKLEGT